MKKRRLYGYARILMLCNLILRIMPLNRACELSAHVMQKYSDRFLKMHCIRRNLEDAFPELAADDVEKITREVAANLGRHIAEMAHASAFRANRKPASLEFDFDDSAYLSSKSPAIFVGAHLGSWELAPLALQRHGLSLTVVYSRDKNSAMNHAIQALRQNIGGTYVEKSEGPRPIMDALARKSSVALLVDQRVDNGIEVEFFGKRSIMTRLPSRMALKFGCPIIPFEVVRTAPCCLRVVLHEPIIPFDDKGKRAETEITQEIAYSIQGSIERNKNSWFCNTRRWKTRPIISTSGNRQVKLASSPKPPAKQPSHSITNATR